MWKLATKFHGVEMYLGNNSTKKNREVMAIKLSLMSPVEGKGM